MRSLHHSKAVRNKILDPLNMQHSYYKAIEKHKYDIASGYFINNEEEISPPHFIKVLIQKLSSKTQGLPMHL